MIASLLEVQRGDAGAYADGLSAWISGDQGIEAEAASRLTAEVLLACRAFIFAQAEGGKRR